MSMVLPASVLFPRPVDLPVREPELRVGFLLAPRFSLLPVASFLDALRHAADEADFGRQIYCSWKILGQKAAETVEASCGLVVQVETKFPDPREFDHLVVAGGQLPQCLEIGEDMLAYIRKARRAGVGLVGICTGSFLLAKSGVMDGHRCAVHVEHERQLRGLFPHVTPVTDQIIVSDNGILTCPGGSSALDLAFTIIRTKCGRSRAVKALTSLMVGRGRMAELAPDHEYAYLATCGHQKVEQAMGMMVCHLSSPFQISDLASRLNITKSGLHAAFLQRAGTGPLEVWRNIRLTYGRWLLLNSNRPVTEIAYECGFADAAHFSRWFKRKYHKPPSEFRAARQDARQSSRKSTKSRESLR